MAGVVHDCHGLGDLMLLDLRHCRLICATRSRHHGWPYDGKIHDNFIAFLSEGCTWIQHEPSGKNIHRGVLLFCVFFSCSFQPVLAGKQQASLRIAKGPLTSMCCFDLLYEVWILQKWRIGYGYACHCRLRLSNFFQHVGSEELKLQTLFKLQGCTWMSQEVGINGL